MGLHFLLIIAGLAICCLAASFAAHPIKVRSPYSI